MNRIMTDRCTEKFIFDWISQNDGTVPNSPPPIALEEYEEYMDGCFIYAASGTKDSDGSQIWLFRIPEYKDTKRESLTIIFNLDGSVEEINDSSGGVIESPYIPLNPDDGFNYPLRAFLGVHLIIMRFLAAYKPELREYSEKCVDHSKSKPNGKIRKSVYTRIPLYKYVNDIKSGKKRLPPRKCEYRFGVRGHYRHYKSGKVIFIKPFEKNKGKPKQKDTYYQLPAIIP